MVEKVLMRFMEMRLGLPTTFPDFKSIHFEFVLSQYVKIYPLSFCRFILISFLFMHLFRLPPMYTRKKQWSLMVGFSPILACIKLRFNNINSMYLCSFKIQE